MDREGMADLISRGKKKSAGSYAVDKGVTVLRPPHPSHSRQGRVLAAMQRDFRLCGQLGEKARWCGRSNVVRDRKGRAVDCDAGSPNSS